MYIKRVYFLLLFFISSSICLGQELAAPTSSAEAGIYTSAFELELSHEEPGTFIFYTINGNEPTVGDIPYVNPILLENRSEEPDLLSTIPTNPSLTYPYGTYSAVRAASRGWVPPHSDGYKINVIRYRAFKPGFAPSKTITQTFIVDPLGDELYSMPIISLAIDYDDMFSDENGIYVYGNHPDANYGQKGPEWERILSFEYLDKNGLLAFTKNCRARIHGGGSRHAPKKSFRLYGETEDENNFKYAFFEDTELEKFKRILLKSGGHRPDCFPRDDLGNMITKGLNIEQQHFRHVIVFINGEYWGVHAVKERLDKYFLQNTYGIDDNNLTLLDQEYDVQDGHAADSALLKNLEEFIIVNDMTVPANYAYVLDRVDIENYIDYMCAEIFLSNEDWVYSNVNIWRKTGPFNPDQPAGHNGKFRWALYDLDGAFGGSCANAFYTVNTLNAATVETGTFSSYSRFFRGLLENPEFKIRFINRMSDLTNSWFKASELLEKIDSIYTMLTPEILENTERWRYPSYATTLEDRYTETPSIDRWNDLHDLLDVFATRRQRKIREHIIEKWGYGDTNKLTINVNNPEMGRVKVNSILINKNLPGVSESLYPWIGDYIDGIELPLIAVPLPGYRFIEWAGTGITNDTTIWVPSGNASYTAVFGIDPEYQPIVINEVMLSNADYSEDNFEENDDWSELYNPNPYPVNISACQLKLNGNSWTIPNNYTIPANGYKLFWHDRETYQGSNHVSFKLSNQTDTLFLISPTGEEINALRYPITATDNSYGRYPNGSDSYGTFTYPTPLQNNDISSLGEIDFPNELSAYPNPTSNNLYFNKIIDLQLFDLKGNLVLSAKQTNQISVSKLSAGTYVIRTDMGETVKISIK